MDWTEMFVVLTLASYRLQRFVTTDDWPLSERFRDLVAERFGPESAWYRLLTCAWCYGTWVTFAVHAGARHLGLTSGTPLRVGLEALASATLVGFIGTWEGARAPDDEDEDADAEWYDV